ncbi:hypothetical protein V6N12_070084 [Hibiscus sabdariffa]|uniref:Uncharacterized protein n=1 Tax=Hibiscus sabdariffa TaxID=183260 RepID=A0ABR2FFQ9_9ROSI
MAAQSISSFPPPSPNTLRSSNTTSLPSPIISLQQPSNKKGSSKPSKLLKRFRSVFRSFPIITPACKIPVSLHGSRQYSNHIQGGARMTGTLFGYRKARVNLAIQENSGCLPVLVLELAITTGKLLQEMGSGMVRIALESEKRPSEKVKILNEPIWTLFCNGRKSGYAVKREATDEDLMVMQILKPVSTGAGVISTEASENSDGELRYMRAYFERVVNSRDSETYYMMNPDATFSQVFPSFTCLFYRMFLKVQMPWNVIIPADSLDAKGLMLKKAIVIRLMDEFACKKAAKDLGYFMAVTTLESIGKGRVRQNMGDVLFPVVFSGITFKMFRGEILQGVVHKVLKHGVFLRCGPVQNIYLSHIKMPDYHYVPGESGMFMNDKHSKIEKDVVIRFIVIGTKWMEAEREFQALVSLEGDYLGPVS